MNSFTRIEERNGQIPLSTFTYLHPLNVDLVVAEILSHCEDNYSELIKFRLVCHKWNDIIVQKVNNSGHSFRIPLRYGPEVPQFILQSDARRWTIKILENVNNVLTGTASKLHFDSVLIDRDLYLAGSMPELSYFLEIQGKSIRHLKFKIRNGKFNNVFDTHYVTDCEEIVSMENLRAIFSSVTNLESLDFCVRFSKYVSDDRVVTQRSCDTMFFNFDLIPQLNFLKKITIREPQKFSYNESFLKEIFFMAPNLMSLYVKPFKDLSNIAGVMKSLEYLIRASGSLTSLKINNARFTFNDQWDIEVEDSMSMSMRFSYINLTVLEIDNIYGIGKQSHWFEKIIRAQHSTLVSLILGNIKQSSHVKQFAETRHYELPPALVMKNLKRLEVNSNKFRLKRFESYVRQFPVLENFTLSGFGTESSIHLLRAYFDLWPNQFSPSAFHPSFSLKELCLIGSWETRDKEMVLKSARDIFPMADVNFVP